MSCLTREGVLGTISVELEGLLRAAAGMDIVTYRRLAEASGSLIKSGLICLILIRENT